MANRIAAPIGIHDGTVLVRHQGLQARRIPRSVSGNDQHLPYADGSPLLFNVHNRRRREGYLACFELKVI